MLTQSRTDDFQLIKEQPSITQKELQSAGISAVLLFRFTSNRKSCGAVLLGRYILSERPYFIVISAANMDGCWPAPDISLCREIQNPWQGHHVFWWRWQKCCPQPGPSR